MVFEKEYTFQDVLSAYFDCRRRKRNKVSSIAFEAHLEDNIWDLWEEVNSGRYEVGRSSVFVVTKPKCREVWAALFRDRVVHHLVYNDIGPAFESRFIEDTFSCIKGRGTMAATERLADFLRRATNNYSRTVWCLQFDIKNFFGSIDKEILWNCFSGRVDSDIALHLLRKIIFNDPTVNPIIKGCRAEFAQVPPHKSLWRTKKDVGLPIGNLTSQFFSNVYLDGLDKFVKHDLRAKNYIRYVDDAVILGSSKSQLETWLKRIGEYVRDNLKLSLHPDKSRIFRADQGINFVGSIVKPYRNYTRRSTVVAAKRAARIAQVRPEPRNIASVNSYLGLLRQTASHKIRRKICTEAVIPTIVVHDPEYKKLIKL